MKFPKQEAAITSKKRIKGLLVLLASIFSVGLLAQHRISGRLLEAGSEKVIPFANIGIVNTTIGSLSNEDGSFSIEIPETYVNQSILFASLGYESKNFNVEDLVGQQELRIELVPKSIELQPITLISEKAGPQKSKVFGNGRSFLLSGTMTYDSVYAGSAVGIRINRKPYPDLKYVHNVSLYIAGNKSPDFKVRLRFMEVDSTQGGIPGKDLIEDQILAYSSLKRGWLQFKLPKPYRIDEPAFYMVFEWIMDREDRRFVAEQYETYLRDNPNRVQYDTLLIDGEQVVEIGIGKILAGTMFGTTQSQADLKEFPTYFRSSSFGSWERSGSTLSAKVELGNRPYPR